jgi:rubredoxin
MRETETIGVALMRCEICGYAPPEDKKIHLCGQKKWYTPEQIVWGRIDGSWKCPKCGAVND